MKWFLLCCVNCVIAVWSLAIITVSDGFTAHVTWCLVMFGKIKDDGNGRIGALTISQHFLSVVEKKCYKFCPLFNI